MTLPWGLYRKPDGALEVAYRAFYNSTWRLISSHETKPDAARALEDRQRADEREALRDAGQGELFGGGR